MNNVYYLSDKIEGLDYIIYIEGYEKNTYGLSKEQFTFFEDRQITYMILVNILNITYEAAMKWCKKHNPTLRIFDIKKNEEMVYDYKKGFVGVQLSLFDMNKIGKDNV